MMPGGGNTVGVPLSAAIGNVQTLISDMPVPRGMPRPMPGTVAASRADYQGIGQRGGCGARPFEKETAAEREQMAIGNG